MKHKTAVLTALVLLIAGFALAQTAMDKPAIVSSFLGRQAALPDGYSFRMSAAYPPYEKGVNYPYGSIGVGLDGLFELTWSHDGAMGSPTGSLTPDDLLSFRLQVVPQRERFPGVSVFLTTMPGKKSEFFSDGDLRSKLPEIYQRGLVAASYDARSTVAGVGLASSLNDMFSYNVSLGARQMVWQQQWSASTINTGLPRTPDGWTYPLPERSNFWLDMAAGVSFRPIEELALIGEAGSLPFVEIDPISLMMEARQGYTGAIGIRYYLPIPLSVDLYDRWYSENGDRTNYHQIRFGLSTQVKID